MQSCPYTVSQTPLPSLPGPVILFYSMYPGEKYKSLLFFPSGNYQTFAVQPIADRALDFYFLTQAVNFHSP